MTSPHAHHRRPMAAGHVVLVVAVALSLATVMNANALMHTAESLPLDSTKRDVAVGVMRPIKWVANHLGITEPRERLDTALGKQIQNVDDPFAEFGPSTTPDSTPRSTNPNETTTSALPTTTTTQLLPVPTEHDPLRLYVAGDSLAFEYGRAIGRAAERHPLLDSAGEVDYQVSTGLARPDKFNWPARLGDEMVARDPDVVLLMLGSNDDQPLAAPDGSVYEEFTDGWVNEYRRRVAAVMDQVIAGGRVVMYVGIPVMRDTGRNAGYEVINNVLREEARARERAYYVDAYELLQDADGGYAQYLPDENGELHKMRADDGIHLERPGADRLTQRTVRLIGKAFDLTAL